MTVFAVSLLYQDVVDRFADDELTANIVFGWREPAKQINQGPGRANRVCFVPGVDGKAGDYGPARFPGTRNDGSPRHLATFHELVSVYVWAFDGDAPNDELKQYEACRDLHDSVVRAIYLSPNVKPRQMALSDPKWLVDRKERRFGVELVFTIEIEGAIVDEPSVGKDAPGIPAPRPETATGPAISVFGTTENPTEITDGTDTTVGA